MATDVVFINETKDLIYLQIRKCKRMKILKSDIN